MLWLFRDEETTNHADHNSYKNVGAIYQSLQTTKSGFFLKDSTDKTILYLRVTNNFRVSGVDVQIKL